MPSYSEQLEKLIEMRTGWDYTPKTDEQLKTQAEGEYQSYYDQLRLAARQQQQNNDLRLIQQRDSLQGVYDQQREESARQYSRAYSQADRQLLSRGMQRSSYAGQVLAGVGNQSVRAQQQIADAQAAAVAKIEDQRTQLQQNLDAQMAQYTASQQNDVMKRMRELQDTEYNRQVDAWKSQSTLTQQIMQAMYQQERDKIADQQWEREFNENVRQFDLQMAMRGGGGGGDSGGGGSYNPGNKNPGPTNNALYEALSGNSSKGAYYVVNQNNLPGSTSTLAEQRAKFRGITGR